MIVRRRPKNKRLLLGRLQPSLTAGAIILNLGATVSAAVSAYYSSQQSAFVTEAANRQSRNEAVSEFARAHDALCRLTLSPFDQVEYTSIHNNDVFVRLDFERVGQLEASVDVDGYIKQYDRASAEVIYHLQHLSIWISDDEVRSISSVIDDATSRQKFKVLLNSSLTPAVALVSQHNVNCRLVHAQVIEYLRNAKNQRPISEFRKYRKVIIYPYSKAGTREKTMRAYWGLPATDK